MEIKEKILLEAQTTFRMGGSVSFFSELASIDDVEQFAAFAQEKNLPLIIIGGGSNVIFPDRGVLEACVGRMRIRGFEILYQNNTHTTIKVGAGEVWDEVVARTVALGLSGIEALSSIPGSAGATPIQNVGAYGQDISQTLVDLEAYDRVEGRVVTIPASDCGFSYRDSRFKHEWKDRFIILSLTLLLDKKAPSVPAYPGVGAYFEAKQIKNPSLGEIREGIIEIRKKKLPDPRVVASCGSFFKNPIIMQEQAMLIKKEFPGAVLYPMQGGMVKVAAGWMIEQLGFKGKIFGGIEVYPHNALVLVNRGAATRDELDLAVLKITEEVTKAFNVELELEVVRIS